MELTVDGQVVSVEAPADLADDILIRQAVKTVAPDTLLLETARQAGQARHA